MAGFGPDDHAHIIEHNRVSAKLLELEAGVPDAVAAVLQPVADAAVQTAVDEAAPINDALMTSVAADSTSAFAIQQNATIVEAVEKDASAVTVSPDSFTARNASAPLTIPTYDGTGSALHPSVVSVPTGWNGYRYWMAMTPYSDQNITLENPSILASDDGQTWVVPAGLTNPVVAFQGSSTYNSDTDLFLAPDGTMYLFWRTLAGSGVTTMFGTTFPAGSEALFYKTSTDGITWSDPVAIMSTVSASEQMLSPAFLFDPADSLWKMWCVDGVAGGPISVRTAPSLAGPWSSKSICVFPLPINGGYSSLRQNWHLSVRKFGQLFYALSNDTEPGAAGTLGDLYLGVSRDGLTWKVGTWPLLSRTTAAWETALYRACLQPAVIDGQQAFEMWYSTKSGGPTGQQIAYAAVMPIQRSSDSYISPEVIASAVVPYQPYVLGDYFHRPDGAIGSAPSGQVWSTLGGAPLISGHALVSSTVANMKVSIDPGLTQFVLEAEITCAAADEAWIMFRVQDATNYMRIGKASGNSLLVLQRVIGSSDTAIVFGTLPATTFRLTLHLFGNTLRAYVNGKFMRGWAVGGQMAASTGVGFQTVQTTTKLTALSVRRLLNGK